VVFQSFPEVIRRGTGPWTNASILKPIPTLLDFRNNYVTIPQNLSADINNLLDEKSFCLIVGGQNAGKTWLTYSIAYDIAFVKQKSVFYTTVNEDFKEEDAWKEIAHYYENKVQETLYFIIEDCHINRKEVEQFLLRVYDVYDENVVNFKFIFNTRKVGKFILRDLKEEDYFYDKLVQDLKCDIQLSKIEIGEISKSMVNNFIKIKEVDQIISEEEISSVVNKWGDDLYLVHLYLKWWDYRNSQNLNNIDQQKIYNNLWDGYGAIALNNYAQRQILCRLAAICQFEPLTVPKEFLRSESISDNELINLRSKGIIEVDSTDYLRISDNLSQLILSAVASNLPSFNKDKFTKESFSEYIEIIVKGDKMTNLQIVLQALNLVSDEYSKIARDITQSLIKNEILTEIKTKIKEQTLDSADSMISNILPLFPEEAKELSSIYSTKNYQKIKLNLKLSSATRINKDLSTLSRIIDLNVLFSSFSVSDFVSIIQNSSLKSIRVLFFSFKNWNLNIHIRLILAKALVTIPNNSLVKLVAEHDSLFMLGGLIGFLREVDDSFADKFIENLAQIDLSELFLKKDKQANKHGFSNINVINYFLSRIIYSNPDSARKIIDRIDKNIWLNLMESSSISEEFWLLWNIYRLNKRKAKLLVQNNNEVPLVKKIKKYYNGVLSGLIQNRISPKQDEIEYYLPAIGLLHECCFDVSRFPLIENNIVFIKEDLKHFEEFGRMKKPHPSLFILSLISLRIKLKSNEYDENIKGYILNQEPMYSKVFNNNDPQLGTIFADLITKYSLAL